MPEQDLDAVIGVVLRTDCFVTSRQKRVAWERLEQRAARQTMWPPLTDPEPRSLDQTFRLIWSWVRRCVAVLLVDEEGYERARQQRLASYSIAVGATNPAQMMIENSPQNRSHH